ncbi:hypothetical protein [Streptomyces roseus]|nr:hypothetical protein [Streptomyces roseus]
MIIWINGPFGGGPDRGQDRAARRPDTDGPLRARLRRALVGVRHMRFD